MPNPLARAMISSARPGAVAPPGGGPEGNPFQPYAGRSSAYAPPGMLSQGWSQVDYSSMVGLPRPMETFTSGDFSPLAPILPVPIDVPDQDGRQRPRRWQVPVGFNLPVGTPGTEGIKLAAYQQLRDMAEVPSIARVCVEIRKADLIVSGNAGEDQGWDIVPTQQAGAAMQGNPRKRADFEKRKEELVQFFLNPDPDSPFDGFEGWANAMLEDALVLDAVSIYVQPAGGKGNGPLGSDVGALALIDGCYSDDTEVLTRRGWLRFAEADIVTDYFATRNPKTRAFEWQAATHRQDYEYDGEMCAFRSRSLDLLVTPNHRMLVDRTPRQLRHVGRFGYPGGETIVLAAELATCSAGTAIPATSTWDGLEVLEFRIPRKPRPGKPPAFEALDGDDFAAFMGMWLAEGSVTWNGPKSEPRRPMVYVTQLETSKGWQPFRHLLTRLFGKEPSYDGHSWCFRHADLAEYLRQFGHATEKFVPDAIKDMSARQLAIFWEYYRLGDGHTEVSGRQTITTVSHRMAGDLQEIAQKLGYSASVQASTNRRSVIRGRVIEGGARYNIRLRTSAEQRFTATKEGYRGQVHCVTVPNGVLYVRRNGRPAWCGNSSVKPLVDEWGSRPRQPAPAYQQYMWSVPRVDLMDIINLGPDATIEDYKALNPIMDELMDQTDEWRGSEMIYFRQNARTWTPYGFGPVEQGILPLSLLQARQMWQGEYYRNGSLPSVFLDPGESIATPEEARQLMQAINQLGGDLANMHQVIVIPPGGKTYEQKPVDLTSDTDTWFAGLVTMPFGLTISDLGIVPKIASMMSPAEGKMAAQQASDKTTRRSALPLARKLGSGVFNRLIRGKFGQKDMRWSWGIMDQGESRSAKITDALSLLKGSVTSIDETRISLDMDPLGEDWSSAPLQFLATGVIPMGQAPPALGPSGDPGATAIDAASKPAPPRLPPGGPAKKPVLGPDGQPLPPGKQPAANGNGKPAGGKKPAKPGDAAEADQTVADQAQAAVPDSATEPHNSAAAPDGKATAKEKSAELRALRRFLANGRPLERFTAKALRPSALRAAAGEGDPARAAWKVAKAQHHVDRREAALAPVRAAAGTEMAALVVELVSGVIDVGEFVALAKKALSTHYQTAYLAGQAAAAQQIGAQAQHLPSGLVLDKANARADSLSPYLKDLGHDALALGTLAAPATFAQIESRASSYGNGVTGAYEEGQVTSYPGPTTPPPSGPDEEADPTATADGTPSGIRWVAEDDPCENCAELDGKVFSEEALPGFPGDGSFGQDVLCLGGGNCRCHVEFVSGDEVLAQSQQPSYARQAMAGDAPDWVGGSPLPKTVTARARAVKDISLGSPLGSGMVPFDLSGPGGTRAPDHVGDDNAYRTLGIPHDFGGEDPKSCTLCGFGEPAALHHKAEKAEGQDGSPGPATQSSTPAVLFAGLVLRAADTGRWLGLQRAINDLSDGGSSAAAGKWEIPGGHLEPGETPEAGAAREWEEEVGTPLPDDAAWVSTWTSGAYQGFVVETESEAAVRINQGPAREIPNPDGDAFEACAWHSVTDLGTLPVREEMRRSMPQILHALAAPGLSPKIGGPAPAAPPLASPKAKDRDPAAQHVHDYLSKNYEQKDLDWVDGCTWQLRPAVHLDTIEWAHRPGGRDEKLVEEKVEEIKGGKQPKPVVLVAGGGPKLVVADGYYRTEALDKAGHETTAAWVGTPEPSDTDWPQKVRQMQYNTDHVVPREDAREELRKG